MSPASVEMGQTSDFCPVIVDCGCVLHDTRSSSSARRQCELQKLVICAQCEEISVDSINTQVQMTIRKNYLRKQTSALTFHTLLCARLYVCWYLIFRHQHTYSRTLLSATLLIKYCRAIFVSSGYDSTSKYMKVNNIYFHIF